MELVPILNRQDIARSLRQHRELILNYFRAQRLLSGGVVRDRSLGKLPELESTHEFFLTNPNILFIFDLSPVS